MTNKKTLSMKKKDETAALETERDALEQTLRDLEEGNGTVEANGYNPDPGVDIEPESNLKAAMRKGRERSDPRFIEAAKRDPDMLDMGADYDLKMNIHDSKGQLKGYHTHWIVDKPGRIQRLLGIGYEPIYKDGIKVGDGPDDFNDNQDTWVSMVSGTLEGGRPQISYAMKIDQELYDMYKSRQRKERVTDVEDQIRSGHFEEKPDENRYVKQMTLTT